MTRLRQLFYFSRARTGLTDSDVRQILWISQRNNRQRDFTGCLLFSGQHFAQVLEGDPEALEQLLAHIRKDERHSELVVAIDHVVPIRKFSNWSMGILYKLEVAGLLEALLSSQQMPEAEALRLLDEMHPDTLMGSLS
ncbi:MAG TPA: BLUF domain-containing protein [Burkholderiaceae bacterium]|nr:BLUF domain-containing protein [Burkholderiaceae bacterium]